MDTISRSHVAVRRLALARLVSVTGGFAAQTALMYRIYAITGSTIWVTATAIASSTAVALTGLAGGLVSDRFDRRRVMVISDLAGAACFVMLAVVRSPGPMVAVAFASAMAEAPFWPASGAAVPNLVAPAELAWANGLLVSATYVALGLGPLAGGVLVAAFGASVAFIVNALSFVVSAVLVARIEGRFSAERDEHETADHRIGAGLALVVSDPVLRVLTAVITLLWGAFGLFVVLDVPLAAAYHAGPVGYATLTAVWGGTAFLGSRVAGRVLARIDERLALTGGLLVVALTGASIALLPAFALIVVVGGAGGLGQGVVMVAWRGMVQRGTPDRVRGRVFAAADAFQETAFMVGMLAGGGMVGLVGVQPSYWAPGAVVFLAAVAAWTLPRRTAVPAPGSGEA